MTVSVPPWVVIGVLWLALFGVVFLWRWARGAARDARTWWCDRREPAEAEECPVCHDTYWDLAEHLASGVKGCSDAGLLEELPPERSREALGFSAPHGPVGDWNLKPLRERTFLERLEARRERLASAAELEHRAAYEAMGLEYPSGLLARVREAAP